MVDSHFEEIRQLIESGVDPGAPYNEDGMTLLHYWCGAGREDIADLLLSHGADPNPREKAGWTALHFAVSGDHLQTVIRLLHAGADPHAQDIKGQTPLSLAAKRSDEVRIALESHVRAEEAAERKWLSEVRRGLEAKFSELTIREAPEWHLNPCVAVWMAEDPGGSAYWVIGGDVPFDRIPRDLAGSPREAIRQFGLRWGAGARERAADGADRGSLQERVETLLEWTDDDHLWTL